MSSWEKKGRKQVLASDNYTILKKEIETERSKMKTHCQTRDSWEPAFLNIDHRGQALIIHVQFICFF